MLLWTPFVPFLCRVCKEIWVDVCDGRDPSQQTMSGLKRGFFLFSLPSLLVRCKFTWPLNSSPHKLLSFVPQLLFGDIRRHCCLGHSWGMLSLGVYVRRPFLTGSACSSFDTSCEKTPGQNNNTLCGNMQEYIFVCHLNQHRIPTLEKMLLMSGLS